MVGITFVMLVLNAFIFSLIFWIITYICKWLYSNKYYKFKLNFYECGFKSTTNININYNINFILLFLFLLIYEGEFFILIPYSLTSSIITLKVISLILFFFFWFIVILLFDFIFNALDWQV